MTKTTSVEDIRGKDRVQELISKVWWGLRGEKIDLKTVPETGVVARNNRVVRCLSHIQSPCSTLNHEKWVQENPFVDLGFSRKSRF